MGNPPLLGASALVLFLLLGHAGSAEDQASTHQRGGENELTFLLVNAALLRPETGVEVLLVGPGQPLRPLGTTDSRGALAVKKDVLESARGGALLFCKKYYQCSAMRLDDTWWTDYDEYTVAITGIILR